MQILIIKLLLTVLSDAPDATKNNAVKSTYQVCQIASEIVFFSKHYFYI